jgi:MFS family permease
MPMTSTIATLIAGLCLVLVGAGLLGTLLGVRAAMAAFGDLETGLVMAGYYGGYILGTLLVPRIIRNVGHIRTFAACAALTATTALSFGLWVESWVWLLLRFLNGTCMVGLYMVVESWINEQSTGPARGRLFSTYMMSTLAALAAGQLLLVSDDPAGPVLFILAAMLISLGLVPIAVTRVTEPRIELAVAVGLRHLFRISPLGALGALVAGGVNGAFWGMAPLFGQRLALAEGEIATLMSATILGGALLQWPIGHLSDRHDRRTVLVLTSFATAAVAFVAGGLVEQGYTWLVPVGFLYGGLMFSLYGLSVAHTNDHLHRTEVLEATRGLLLVYGLGALAGPLLGGLAMELMGPTGLPAFSAAAPVVLGLFGLFRMSRRAPPPVEEQSEFVALVRTTPMVLEMHPDAELAPELDLQEK